MGRFPAQAAALMAALLATAAVLFRLGHRLWETSHA